MTATFQELGSASGTNVTSLSITTSGNLSAGAKIFVAVCIDKDGFDEITDSVNGPNNYNQVAGSQDGVGAFLFELPSTLRMRSGSTITVDNNVSGVPFSGRIAAVAVSGLTAGNIDGSSAGQGTNNAPLVALDNVPAGDEVVGIVAVAAGSSDTFTQDPNFTSPALNTQQTTGFSSYFGWRTLAAGGHVQWNPSLAQPATWAALLVAVSP